jgi:hypothetical protein
MRHGIPRKRAFKAPRRHPIVLFIGDLIIAIVEERICHQ